MERKPLIAGNWKMNLDLDEAVSLVNAIIDSISDLPEVDVLVAPPFTALTAEKRPLETPRFYWAPRTCIGK